MAPKFTKCGHVYCWTCISRHISIGDKYDHKCPICFEYVSAKDLKSVRYVQVRDYSKLAASQCTKGEESAVHMRLIQRANNSAISIPKSLYASSLSGLARPLSVNMPEAMTFCKLVTASSDYVRSDVLGHEMSELDAQLAECKSSGELDTVPFIEAALKSVEASMLALEAIAGNADPKLLDAMKTRSGSSSRELGSRSSPKEKEKEPYYSDEESVFLKADDMPSSPSLRSKRRGSKSNASLDNPGGRESNKYFFYQAADGQYVYLHPLDIKMLKHEFGSYEDFPDDIRVVILEFEESTLTEELRRRYKYLNHLPLGCDVAFCEVDLANVVSNETIAVFAQELKQRRLRRLNRIKKEERQMRRMSNPRDGASGSSATDAFSSGPSERLLSSSYPPKGTPQFDEEFPLPAPVRVS